MFRRDILSWWLRPRFLRTFGRRRSTLFAGPWVGEFGWELMNWQGFVRKLASRYRKVIVSCRAGHEVLYQDFATCFEPHDIRGQAECNRLLRVDNPDEVARIHDVVPADADHLRPVGYQPSHRQVFVRLGKKLTADTTDVLVHPRARSHGTDRNWSADKWDVLLTRARRAGLRVGCIGLRSATLALPGELIDRDFRDAPLAQTVDQIASTRLVVGPSSGPMHLASLCGTPHLVWTDRRRYAHGLRNRDKYERVWNPFHVAVTVLDRSGFDPDPNEVWDSIEARLSEGRDNGH